MWSPAAPGPSWQGSSRTATLADHVEQEEIVASTHLYSTLHYSPLHYSSVQFSTVVLGQSGHDVLLLLADLAVTLGWECIREDRGQRKEDEPDLYDEFAAVLPVVY